MSVSSVVCSEASKMYAKNEWSSDLHPFAIATLFRSSLVSVAPLAAASDMCSHAAAYLLMFHVDVRLPAVKQSC